MEQAHLPLSALTRLTGLSPHVLRAWQARYGFPEPERTAGGHRRYSPGEAERLRQAAILTRSGIRAGDAIEMVRGRRAALPAHLAQPDAVRQLTDRLVAGDKLAALMQLRATWLAVGLSATLESLTFPALRRVGDLWASGRISVAEEHAASGIVLSWLGSLRTDFAWKDRPARVLIAAPEGEEHAAGIWALELLLGEAGVAALALGGDVPTTDLVAEVRRRRTSAVVLGIARAQLKPVLREIVHLTSRLPSRQRPLLLVGGAGAEGALPDGVRRLTGTVTEAAAEVVAIVRARR